MGTAGAAAEGVATVQQSFGRWVKLTEESAKQIANNSLMTGSSDKVARAIVVDGSKKTKHIVEFMKMTPKQALTNPALLAGVGGIMAQIAMQQAMDEITAYLKVIDAKVDDVIRAQKDVAIANVVGADFLVQEAFAIRDEVGVVSDTNWSKVQALPQTLHTAQAHALRRLDALAEKLERTTDVSDLAELALKAQTEAQEWLAVIAHCFKLQEAVAVLELDRVLNTDAEQLDLHRRGLQVSRQRQRDVIGSATARLLERMVAAAEFANTKTLRAPFAARKIVNSSNHVAGNIVEFNHVLGIEQEHMTVEAVKWRAAVASAGQKVADVTSDGAHLVARASRDAGERVAGRAQQIATDVGERIRRPERDDYDDEDVPWLLADDESAENH